MRLLQIVVFFATVVGFPAAAETWTITAEQAQCILSNKASYVQDAIDVVVIPVAVCPETDLTAIALDGQKNLGTAPNVATTASGSGVAYDEIIVYRTQDLECLTSAQIAFEGEKAVLPKIVACD